MAGIDGLQTTITGIGEDIIMFISEKPITSALIGTSVLGATTLGIVGIRKRRKKKKTTRGRSRDRKYISKQKHETAYQKRRKKAGKKTYGKKYKTKTTKKTKKRVGKVYYTKKGQPYKIMSSGKARFIKKKKGGKK